jgi:16S rRNA (guanine966-N2)-methyltransferase
MKIISGKLKGRNIEISKNPNYRPSTSKFRESIFSMLSSGRFEDFDINEAQVLDLFCGTGSLGLEAISRGAKSTCFVDINVENLNQIRNFSKKTGIENQVSYINIDASKLCNFQLSFDLVFIDPPYNKNLIEKTLEALLKHNWLNKNCYIIIECEKSEDLKLSDQYQFIDERRYAKTKMIVIKY